MTKNKMFYNYIVFEGLVGSDKTKFIEKLSNKITLKSINNSSLQNPFLSDFYKDINSYAFQTQIFYLLSRYNQQSKELVQYDLFNETIVADYYFERDEIFAKLTLSEAEYKLYEQIYLPLKKNIRTPNLLVYFHSTTNDVIKKIRTDSKSYSKYISSKYIADLNDEFTKYFYNYDKSPLLIVETSKVDFDADTNIFEEVYEQIINLRSARKFYNPIKERTLF
jgi:deoxyguanosine kinase